MKNKQRKRQQRKINKAVRELNKNIKEDNLWRGRFKFAQTDAVWYAYEDGSGGELSVWIEARDLKTGLYYGFIIDNYNARWLLWTKANKFIADYSGVWKDIEAVKKDTTNWDTVKWIPKKAIY